MNEKTKEESKTVAVNRKARHEYFIIETFEAGIVLTGTEIKSVRESRLSIAESYASTEGGEIWINNMNISPYESGNRYNHEPLRKRKLLLKRMEIRRLIGKLTEKGLTLIPLSVYLKGNKIAKVNLALAKGKKLYDKREDIAERDADRQMARARRRTTKEDY